MAESVGNFCTSHPAERVAVLVPWNKDADQISRELSNRNIPHFKISGTDLFTTRQAQLLFAHLQVVYMDSNMMAWSKILTGTGIFNDDSEARRFVKYLRDNYLLPSDFLNYTRSSYMLELYRCCQGVQFLKVFPLFRIPDRLHFLFGFRYQFIQHDGFIAVRQ